MMNSFAGIMSIGETVSLTNCLMGLLSFCTIALGGLFIGGSMSFFILENKHRNYGRSDHCPDHEVHQGGIMILSGRVHDILHIILRSELSSHLRSSAALTSLTCSRSLFPSQVEPSIVLFVN